MNKVWIIIFLFIFLFLSSCSNKEGRVSLSPEERIKFYIPSDAKIVMQDKLKYGGAVLYQIERAFPPDEFIKNMNEHYISLNWKPLNYHLLNSLSEGSILAGWNIGREENQWQQDWISETGEAIMVLIRYFEPKKPNLALVNLVLIESRYTLEPLAYYKKIHGGNDKPPNETVIEMLKKENYFSYAIVPNDSVMVCHKIPLENTEYFYKYLYK
jgi:hypothetical protein